ncbi:hypothetical protein K1719_031159 [Acacia pycnantha]|nr:hypothetical protein K1719_031159 [Acacia pycnantha]
MHPDIFSTSVLEGTFSARSLLLSFGTPQQGQSCWLSQRASQGSDGSYDIKNSYDFVYKALSGELFIGNVYLRVYNDHPDFESSEA